MSRRMALRTRLTVFVTCTFAISVVAGAAIMLDRVEDSSLADARSSAERVLGDYLDSINGGAAAVGVVGGDVGTQFFYEDAAGRPLDERGYFELIAVGLDQEARSIGEMLEGAVPVTGSVAAGGVAIPGDVVSTEFIAGFSVLESGELLGPDGLPVTFAFGPVPQGEPVAVDRGDDVVAVSQTLAFVDGPSFVVGVSAPLRPVTDSLDAFARVVWIAVPLLIAAVGAATWMAASRALRPVDGISARARAISADRLADRVPVPEAHDEIRDLAETVNGMLDRIEASQQRQRRLVSDASHELRSPVAASRAQLEVALASADVSSWLATATTVLAEQEHLSALIDDLVTLSRLDERGLAATADVDLGQIVHAEASRPRPLRPTVEMRPGIDLMLTGDRRLLERLVRNLVDNAVGHAATQVALSVLRTTEAVVLHVDDDGPGVAAPFRRAVFERFTRLDEARDRSRGGSGLGLAIVREVAEIHGGSVSCSDAPIGGARFTVIVPVAAERSEAPSARSGQTVSYGG